MKARCVHFSPWHSVRAIHFSLLLMAAGIVASCGGSGENTTEDITGNRILSEYVIQQDVFILSIKGAQAELFVPEQKNTGIVFASGEKVEAPSIAQYQQTPTKWPYLIGVLPKGSHIRVQKFELLHSFEYSKQLSSRGRFQRDRRADRKSHFGPKYLRVSKGRGKYRKRHRADQYHAPLGFPTRPNLHWKRPPFPRTRVRRHSRLVRSLLSHLGRNDPCLAALGPE